ncbi:MAG: hypothetical protein JO118_16050 [Acetobacteraceae bacterium]|nr:hypothetical protein [Acetobacteraceae bacterium]
MRPGVAVLAIAMGLAASAFVALGVAGLASYALGEAADAALEAVARLLS